MNALPIEEATPSLHPLSSSLMMCIQTIEAPFYISYKQLNSCGTQKQPMGQQNHELIMISMRLKCKLWITVSLSLFIVTLYAQTHCVIMMNAWTSIKINQSINLSLSLSLSLLPSSLETLKLLCPSFPVWSLIFLCSNSLLRFRVFDYRSGLHSLC